MSEKKENKFNLKNIFTDSSEQLRLFQKLINNIPDLIYIKDKKSRLIIVNKAMANYIGEKPKNIIGKTDFDIHPEEHAKKAFRDEQKIMKTGKGIVDVEERIIHSGKEYWMSASKIAWYDKKGNVMGTMGISRDITRRKELENEILGKEKSFFNTLMDNITESIFFKDLKSRCVRINKACARKYGVDSPEDAIGKTDFDFFSDEHAKQAFEDEKKIIKSGKPILNFEEKETFKNKPDRWASTSKFPWYDEKGNIMGTFGITGDITEKKKAEQEIKYLSFHDTLTGLYNRAYFEEELKRLDTERQLPLTIVMGDVNGLKLINDTYGHINGDIFLKKIADILKNSFRKEDIISRWGGDEFITILPATTSKDASVIIKRIKKLCKERSTPDMPLSISLGVSTKNKLSEKIGDTLKHAERGMYKNKITNSRSTNEIIVSSLKESLRKTDYNKRELDTKSKEYATFIGKKLKLPSSKIEELKLLLDFYYIGKLALADEIMSKPGSFSNEERELIKKLPEIGYRIAEASKALKPISEAILSHFEWYNGSGYPRGIKGKEIPLISRISLLVNAYGAMSEEKPYRKKMSKEEIKEEIKKYSGTQFDPDVAEIFLGLLEKNTPN
jgi:diguanylate cyclase (GGDEF)-like protein/PAS domain S-box-containing protein